MLDVERRKIISDLNDLFSNFSFLLELANFCNNNYEAMIKMISKIIKYSFCCSVTSSLGYLKTPIKIDEDYKQYLIQTKKKFGFFKKQVNNGFVYPLDEDIRMSDLQGLVLPTISSMIDACGVNKQNQKEEQYKRDRQCLKYREAMGFEDTAFWYSTTDLVKFDSEFLYYHSNLTGNVEVDFYNLYNDERYKDNPNSPLNKPFYENLDHILRVNDIDITRIGNLHVIGNGRHRILYLMYFDCDCKIPVSVTKRIEDKEFNEILLRLKDKYKLSFNKNNIFNDDPDIIINYERKTYNVKNKDELKRFEELLDRGESIEEFFVADYHSIKKTIDNSSFSYVRDKMLVFWLNNKKLNIFEGNYTEYLLLSGEINSNVLYEAFNVNQKIYQKYKLLGIDFEESVLYRLVESTDEKDKTIREIFYDFEREKERGKVYEKETKI